jgi:PAS domain S-box-containing protein
MAANPRMKVPEPSERLGMSSSAFHEVQFYEDDQFLLDGLGRIIGSALGSGNSGVVIATKSHRDGVEDRLRASGVDVALAVEQGRYHPLDASETLRKFMVNGWPDSNRFREVIGATIAQAKENAKAENPLVAAFGEMVAVLWAEGKSEAALELERLWNELATTHSFQLHCAYPMSLFPREADAESVRQICSKHSNVVPMEGYTGLTREDERMQNVIFLQQRAQALEAEITERKRVQQELQRHKEELTDFLENAVLAMHSVAPDGTILWANKAELDLLGYTREEYVGHDISEFHADKDVADDILRRLSSQEELQGYKARLRCKDGTIRYVRIHSNVLREDGDFIRTRCFTIDVTDHERTARRIAAQHTITRLLAESTSLDELTEPLLETICNAAECDFGTVWLLDDLQQRLRCVKQWSRPGTAFPQFENANSSRSFGKGEGLPGRVWASNEPAWIENIANDENLPRGPIAINEGIHTGFAFPIKTLKGPIGVVEFFAREIKKTDDEFINLMVALGTQIGQFMERQQAAEAQRRLAAIVESSDDAIASKDLNGIVTSWNKSAERMFGYKAEEIVGRPILLVIPPELHRDEDMILGKIRRGEKIDHFETVRVTKGGDRIDVSLTISPVKDEMGKVIGAAKIVRNITENKKMERALRITERLATAGRLAATVAHEINNPLESVTNLVYLAKRDLPDMAKASQRLELASRELDRVAHIARQTLGFYRDSSSAVRLNVGQALNDLLSLYEKRLEVRNIKVVKQFEPNLEITALAGEVRQAFSNLISNAVDAMPSGGSLVIRASRSHEWYNSNLPGVRVTILDTGAGIEPRHRKNLFQPFFTTKADVGTGLGLWITRGIVEKHGGKIHMKTSTHAPNHGTVFSIFFPDKAAAPGGKSSNQGASRLMDEPISA